MSAARQWYKQKTTWTGLSAVIAGAGGLVTGQMDVATGIQTIIGGLGLIFLRQATSG